MTRLPPRPPKGLFEKLYRLFSVDRAQHESKHRADTDQQQCWSQLDDLKKRVTWKFPLSASECAKLRANLAERVLATYKAEVAADEMLAELS